jgi:hypothetical protein
MTIFRTDAVRTALMDGLNTQRGTSAIIQIRSGSPDGVGGVGTLLATLTGNVSQWGVVSNGVLTSSAITADTNAAASGTAGHYELLTSGSTFLEAGLLEGSDGVTLDNLTIVAGQTVQMSGDWVNTAAYDDGV